MDVVDVVDVVLRHCGGFQAVEGRSVSALKCQITVRRSKDTAAAGWSSDCLQHLVKAHKHSKRTVKTALHIKLIYMNTLLTLIQRYIKQ